MTKDEALKLALDALETCRATLAINKLGGGFTDMEADAAITAIKQALNDATHLAAPVQEPVAWEQELANILCRIHRDGGHYVAEHSWRKAIDDADLKVAQLNADFDTTPPAAQRQWVELTNEDIDQGLLHSDYALKTAHAWRAGVVFAITKLKEKNA